MNQSGSVITSMCLSNAFKTMGLNITEMVHDHKALMCSIILALHTIIRARHVDFV